MVKSEEKSGCSCRPQDMGADATIGDDNWKSAEDTVDILCRTLTSDSTLLLNVGPMPDGSLTPETEKILAEMGEWTKRNSDAVYGRICGNPFSTVFSWGYAAAKDNKLFLVRSDFVDFSFTGNKKFIFNIRRNKFRQNSCVFSFIMGSIYKIWKIRRRKRNATFGAGIL